MAHGPLVLILSRCMGNTFLELSIDFHFIAILSLWKRVWPFSLNKVESFLLKMLCAKIRRLKWAMSFWRRSFQELSLNFTMFNLNSLYPIIVCAKFV